MMMVGFMSKTIGRWTFDAENPSLLTAFPASASVSTASTSAAHRRAGGFRSSPDRGMIGGTAPIFEAVIAAAIEVCRPVNLTFSIVT
jgi:hypothetical protein